MTREEAKKAYERWHIERFCSSLPGFSPNQLEQGERPDFVLRSGSDIIGIEHTALHRPKGSDKYELREVEELLSDIVNQAQAVHAADSGPPLWVSVHFACDLELKQQRKSQLITELATFVRAVDLSPGESRIIRRVDAPGKALPGEVLNLIIASSEHLTVPLWQASPTIRVPECLPEHLQRVIAAKNKKRQRYRQTFGSVWLVIVADESTSASTFSFPSATLEHEYESRFDRAFLFHSMDKRYIPLKLKSSVG